MKKIICVLLIMEIVLSFCGCDYHAADILEDFAEESITVVGEVVEKSNVPTEIKVRTANNEYVLCILTQTQLSKISVGDTVKIQGRAYYPNSTTSDYIVKLRYCEVLEVFSDGVSL